MAIKIRRIVFEDGSPLNVDLNSEKVQDWGMDLLLDPVPGMVLIASFRIVQHKGKPVINVEPSVEGENIPFPPTKRMIVFLVESGKYSNRFFSKLSLEKIPALFKINQLTALPTEGVVRVLITPGGFLRLEVPIGPVLTRSPPTMVIEVD